MSFLVILICIVFGPFLGLSGPTENSLPKDPGFGYLDNRGWCRSTEAASGGDGSRNDINPSQAARVITPAAGGLYPILGGR